MSMDYRTIQLQLPDAPPAALNAIEDLFNRDFKREDIFLDLSPNEYAVNVRQIDMLQLRSTVDRLIQANGHQGAEAILRETLQAIEEIGSYGIRGRKRVFVGYNDERKVMHRRDKEKRRGRHYYANDHTYKRESTEPPASLTNRIVCGDSTEVPARLPDNCVDLVFTSPPYNFGLEYGESPDDYQWKSTSRSYSAFLTNAFGY